MTVQELEFLAAVRRLRTLRDDEHGRALIRDFIAFVHALPCDRAHAAAFADTLRTYLLIERARPVH